MKGRKEDREYLFDLGHRIKLYRIMKELSQQDLADRTGVSKRTISRLEQGGSVQTDSLFKILIALDLGENIEMLVPDQTQRPSFYLEQSENNKPKRVGRRKEKKEFKWGDEV